MQPIYKYRIKTSIIKHFYSFYFGQPVMKPADFIQFRHDIAISKALTGIGDILQHFFLFQTIEKENFQKMNRVSHFRN